MLGTVKYHSPRTTPSYCPTVKSIRFSTVPAGSRTSTCQAPLQSAGTAFLLQVRQGEPPTASSTSPTWVSPWNQTWWIVVAAIAPLTLRSEEHTSELQSLAYLVCRLLLEKKKKMQM